MATFTLEKPVTEYSTVKLWREEYGHYWGIPVSRTADLACDDVAALERFCARAGEDPDQMINECLRPAKVGDGLVLRTKSRRGYIRLISEFEEAEGSRDAANAVRSFFIHNGVAMTPSALR